MLKSNLIELVSKLNPKEFKDFGEYISSPFFNKNQSVVNLYDYISRYYPDFDEKNFKKELVYSRIFPGTSYNDGFMSTIMFNLSGLAEDYYGYISRTKNPVENDIDVINEFSKRRIDNLCRKRIAQTEKSLNKTKSKDISYFKNKYYLEYAKNVIKSKKLRFLNSKDIPDKTILDSWERRLDYFFLQTAEEARYFYNLKRIIRFDFKLAFLDEIIEYLKTNENRLKHGALFHFYELLLIKENDESYFYRLKDLFRLEINNMEWAEKISTISILVNFASDRLESGAAKFLSELFEIINMMLELKLYSSYEGGYFKDSNFQLCVRIGIMLKKLEWTEKFIEKYQSRLSPEDKPKICNFAYARLFFARGNYERALEYLSKINSINYINDKIMLKNFILMIYYEMNYVNEAMDTIDSYRHLLSHNEKVLNDEMKEINSNFLKIYNELLKIKTNKNKKRFEKVKTQLKLSNVAERQWLFEKIKKIEKQ